MKDRLLVLFAGPVVMVVLTAIGMPTGYLAGFIAACVIVPIIAIGLGVVVDRVTDNGTVAMLAVVLGVLPGLAGAHGCHLVRELETGDFVPGVALAELPAHAPTDRLTLRDGVARRDLGKRVSETTSWSSPRGAVKDHVTVDCFAFPIVSSTWSGHTVSVWRFGSPEPIAGRPLDELVFHPGRPDELCQRAIREASVREHLDTAPDAIYLEALVNDTASVTANYLVGLGGIVLLAPLWIVVALVQIVRDVLANRRRTRAGGS